MDIAFVLLKLKKPPEIGDFKSTFFKLFVKNLFANKKLFFIGATALIRSTIF